MERGNPPCVHAIALQKRKRHAEDIYPYHYKSLAVPAGCGLPCAPGGLWQCAFHHRDGHDADRRSYRYPNADHRSYRYPNADHRSYRYADVKPNAYSNPHHRQQQREQRLDYALLVQTQWEVMAMPQDEAQPSFSLYLLCSASLFGNDSSTDIE